MVLDQDTAGAGFEAALRLALALPLNLPPGAGKGLFHELSHRMCLMRDAGLSNASLLGSNGSDLSLSAGNTTQRTSLASLNSLASLSSLGNFEIGCSISLRKY